jgi:hypothetical protein
MGPNLSCFDWETQASSFLDGTLTPGMLKSAEAHLESCKECRERHQRYRLILESLASLRRYPAPAELKYEREASDKRRPIRPATRGWSRTDRFTRPITRAMRSLSGRTWGWLSLSLLGFLVLTALPKLQSLYDSRLQKRLDAVNFAELPVTQSPPQEQTSEEDLANFDDFSGDEGEEDAGAGQTDSDTGTHLKSASWEGEWDPSKWKEASTRPTTTGAQVWRFIIRTDSPQDLRAKVHEALLEAGVSPQSRMIHGFVAPGGIQFDVLAPASAISELKDALQKLSDAHSPTNDQQAAESPYPTQPFTWYRNRSKRPLPAGAARVVIWLSLT